MVEDIDVICSGTPAPLLGLSKLHSLDITQCEMGAEDLEQFGALTQLTHLGVSFSGDDWLGDGAEKLARALAGLPLRRLSFPSLCWHDCLVEGSEGAGNYVRELSRLTRLTQLTGGISPDVEIAEGVLAATLQQLTNLQALRWEGSVLGWQEKMPSSPQLQPASKSPFLHYPQPGFLLASQLQERLGVHGSPDLALGQQVGAHPVAGAAGEGVEAALRSVVQAFVCLPRLRQLELTAQDVGPAVLKLAAATQLKHLWLGFDAARHVPAADWERLRQLLPGCELVAQVLEHASADREGSGLGWL